MMNNVYALRRLKDRDWDFLEAKLRGIFGGLKSKCGDPMVGHSIDVGRRVRSDKRADDIAIFGGYCHDVLEDTKLTQDDLLVLAKATMDNRNLAVNILADAVKCVNLVVEVSYSDEEYVLPKKERKAAATKRWSKSNDIRVLLIKKCDVESNSTTASKVSKEFEVEYLSWAQPLRETIEKKLAS